MACQNCIVSPLQFEVNIKGANSFFVKNLIMNHFKRAGLDIHRNEEYLMIEESGARELLYFSRDYLDMEQIFFRFDDNDWAPFSAIEHVLETEWIDDLMQRNAIVCHSQPIVDANEEIYAYEILSRFAREDGSLIYPNEVFSAARTRGRLYALDRLCRMAAVRYSAKLNKKTFINFIPTSIYSPEFCLQSTVKLARQLNIDPSQFVFEVVESDKVDDVNHLRNILSYYNEKGFQYALDDVGEGYSTLEMLGDLKPHFMKLDMKYVQGVSQDPTKQAAATMFLQKALEINAIPLAEGVETAEDFEWLRRSGYQLFQGYYFGKPSKEPQFALSV